MSETPSIERLRCADLRHSWQQVSDNVLVKEHGRVRSFSRTLDCVRCGTQRIDVYEVTRHSVNQVSTKYKYNKNYRLKRRLPVGVARMLLFKYNKR